MPACQPPLVRTQPRALFFDAGDGHDEIENDLLPLLKGEVATVRTTHIHNTQTGRYANCHGDWLLIDGRNGYVTQRNPAWEVRHGYPVITPSAARGILEAILMIGSGAPAGARPTRRP